MSLSSSLIKIMQSINEEVSEKAKEMYDELISEIKRLSYSSALDYIDDIVKDPKLRFILSLGFGGELADTELRMSNEYIPVTHLLPTQNEIDVSKSLIWSLNGKKTVSHLFNKEGIVVSPVISFKKRYVIDGHHRWSQAYCTNPDFKIFCINYDGNLSPLSMLKAVQATIGSNIGKIVRSNTKGMSIYDCSENQIRDYIEENLTEISEEELKTYAGLESREDVINYLLNNCMKLRRENKPIAGSPKRDLMPQTSKDPDALSDLAAGVTSL